ncbi:T9SS type A sorting domain-containing protein [Winogradskyella ludwigii]|uniref:T9SS type A sorting domain-containing protein n=1 Tax=Winogradskyella ludwigii TaxID=2686076 RepID=UPI0015CDE60B|nr:T9SS type A sorting domain-containing protein [Winogradskyella ludwigii]
MTESSLGIEMPTFLGSGSEFIPLNNDLNYLTNEIVDINNLQDGVTHVGYVFGGIESTQENIFFINDGTQSSVSNLAFKVFINKSTLSVNEVALNPNNIYNIKIYPNPSNGIFSIEVFIPNTDQNTLEVYNLLGENVKSIPIEKSIGLKEISLDLTNMASGEYILVVKNKQHTLEKKIIKL